VAYDHCCKSTASSVFLKGPCAREADCSNSGSDERLSGKMMDDGDDVVLGLDVMLGLDVVLGLDVRGIDGGGDEDGGEGGEGSSDDDDDDDDEDDCGAATVPRRGASRGDSSEENQNVGRDRRAHRRD
jgi:hypothetical protein